MIVDRQNGGRTSPKSINSGQIFLQPLILSMPSLSDFDNSLWNKKKTKFWSFFPDLCIIWQSHRFQFLGCALPIGIWHLLMDHIKIIKWSPLKLFYKSTIHEKCAHCPYKTLKFGERGDSLKSFSGDQFHDSRQNRRTHMATSILYPQLDFGKADTPVFHGVKRYQKRKFFHKKITNIWKK